MKPCTDPSFSRYTLARVFASGSDYISLRADQSFPWPLLLNLNLTYIASETRILFILFHL